MRMFAWLQRMMTKMATTPLLLPRRACAKKRRIQKRPLLLSKRIKCIFLSSASRMECWTTFHSTASAFTWRWVCLRKKSTCSRPLRRFCTNRRRSGTRHFTESTGMTWQSRWCNCREEQVWEKSSPLQSTHPSKLLCGWWIDIAVLRGNVCGDESQQHCGCPIPVAPTTCFSFPQDIAKRQISPVLEATYDLKSLAIIRKNDHGETSVLR